MLLPAARYDEGVELLEAAFAGVPLRRPDRPRQHDGAADQRRRSGSACSATSRRARPKGRGCWSAGASPRAQPKGCFVEPTLFVDVDPDSTIAQEEIFGPVLSVIKYEDEDDAVRIANNSKYGLSGSVASASVDRALAVAQRIRTGTVSVNGGAWFGPDSPFGGYKDSGIGREHGREGFEEYLEIKTVGVCPHDRRRST